MSMILNTSVKLLTFLIVVFGLCRHLEAKTIHERVVEVEKNLKVSIIYNENIKDTWSSVTYGFCNDSLATLEYLTVLSHEYSKYPSGFFQIIGIRKLVLCTNLQFANGNRAAIPDPYIGSLFLSIDGSYPKVTTEYLIHVMHHELNHCTEYALWKDMYYRWPLWQAINAKTFTYVGSGAMAYADRSKDWYSLTHPEPGFLNLYSTTAEEEDRCELIAIIMTDEQREFIFQYFNTDKILREKIETLLKTLDSLGQTNDTYWNRVMAPLVKDVKK